MNPLRELKSVEFVGSDDTTGIFPLVETLKDHLPLGSIFA